MHDDKAFIAAAAVVIPAADEQEHIGACLEAIAIARRHLCTVTQAQVTSIVVVVLDDCHDETGETVVRHEDVATAVSTARQVGTARRIGVDYVLQSAVSQGVNPAQVWIANTDADSRVPADWLSCMVDLADCGADLVLGTVVPGSGLIPPIEQAWRTRHDTSDDHRHIHGANLGIRASTYLEVGGWPQLASGEDEELVARVLARRYPLRRTGQIPVVTSTRFQGRAPQGFSSYLRALAEPYEKSVSDVSAEAGFDSFATRQRCLRRAPPFTV